MNRGRTKPHLQAKPATLWLQRLKQVRQEPCCCLDWEYLLQARVIWKWLLPHGRRKVCVEKLQQLQLQQPARGAGVSVWCSHVRRGHPVYSLRLQRSALARCWKTFVWHLQPAVLKLNFQRKVCCVLIRDALAANHESKNSAAFREL